MTTCAIHGPQREYAFRGPWFRTDEAAAYVQCLHADGCVSVNAFYQWQRRYKVIAHRGLIAKADLDRALMSGRNVVPLRKIASAFLTAFLSASPLFAQASEPIALDQSTVQHVEYVSQQPVLGPISRSLRAASYGVFVGGQVLDVATTHRALNAGMVEGNPLLGNSIGTIAARKSLLSAGVLLYAWWLEKKGHHIAASTVRFVGGAVPLAAAIHNARLTP